MNERSLHHTEIAESAGGAAQSPAFSEIVARAQIRVRRRRASLGVITAVLAVSAITVGSSVMGGPDGDRGLPARQPISTPAAPEQSTAAAERHAEEMVDATTSVPSRVAVWGADRDQRAAIWRCHRQCHGVRSALALTSNGFASRTVLPMRDPAELRAAGDDRFVVTSNRPGQGPFVASAAGLREVVLSDAAPYPADDDEIVVGLPGSGVRVAALVAVDAGTAEGHRIPLPSTPSELVAWKVGDGRVSLQYAEADRSSSYWWSDDGGKNWAELPLPLNSQVTMFELVATARGQDHFVIESGDGATLMPFVAYHQGSSEGADWRRSEVTGTHATLNGYAARGNELLVAAELWANGDAKPPEPSRLFRAVEGRLSPYGANPDRVGAVSLALREGGSGTTPVLIDVDHRTVLWSEDGDEWKPLRLR